MMTLPRTVADVLSDHVTFEVECIDRMYLNVLSGAVGSCSAAGALLVLDRIAGVLVHDIEVVLRRMLPPGGAGRERVEQVCGDAGDDAGGLGAAALFLARPGQRAHPGTGPGGENGRPAGRGVVRHVGECGGVAAADRGVRQHLDRSRHGRRRVDAVVLGPDKPGKRKTVAQTET